MKGILTLAVAMLFVFSLASVALSADQYSLKGPIVSVDTAGKTFVVKSIEGATSSTTRWKGDITFLTDEMTKINMGKKLETFSDLKAGEKVEVKFHEKDGKYVADRVLVTSEHATKSKSMY